MSTTLTSPNHAPDGVQVPKIVRAVTEKVGSLAEFDNSCFDEIVLRILQCIQCLGTASIAINASMGPVATLTIRDLDDDLKAALRVRAAEHGRSMESEVREILRAVLKRPSTGPAMGTRIRQRFLGIAGAAELEQPNRTERPRAAEFGG